MKIYRILIIAIGIITLSVPKSFSQDVGVDKLTAEDRLRMSNKDTARISELFEAITFVSEQNDTMYYRLLKPLDLNPDKKYPLVVCLAGASARGTDNFKQIGFSCLPLVLAEKKNLEKYPCYVFVPQCPKEHNWGKSVLQNNKTANQGKSPNPGVDPIVFDIIGSLLQNHNIDKNRLYVTGLSMGGTGVWHFILTHPKMFAAAIPVCGGSNPDLAFKITNVPIWTFHSIADELGDVEITRNMVNAIKDGGGNPLYTEYSDLSHKETCIQAFYTPGLLDWLFSQKIDDE